MTNRDATGLWGLFVPHLPKATLYKYASRLRWCEGPRCIFHRSHGCFHIQSAFAYTHTVRLRIESALESAFHRTLFIHFARIKNALDDALSLVQVLLTCGVYLVHPGKQCWNPGFRNTCNIIKEYTMSHHRKKFLSAGLAGVLCSTALFGVAVAHADGRNNLHLPGQRDRPHTPNTAFTRMFPELPPFAPPTDAARDQAKKLGEKGGLLDALDDLSDPVLSITDPARSLNNPDNPSMTAGVTFFGQFLDHDITLDPRSPLLEKTNPGKTTNFRTAAFDLDSLYGSGPKESPELYDVSSGDIKLRVEPLPDPALVSRKGAERFDLPRDPYNNAILGDSRNDEHVVLAQFHLAMLRFHNEVIKHLRADPSQADQSAEQIFKKAQREVRWHYQWIIVHEFLPLTIGQELVDSLLRKGPRFYEVDKRNPLIPIEFSVAAYRFGHSQVRPSYRLNFGPTVTPPAPFFALIAPSV